MADIFQKEIAKALSKALDRDIEESMLELPPDPVMGDYAFPCFTLAREFRKSPGEIAIDLGNKIKPSKHITRVSVLGPYVNFFVNKKMLAELVLSVIYKKGKKYGKGSKKDYSVMIESPGPNTNKPLHLGHVRNMVLGNSLVNLFGFLGYKTIRVDIVNDRGVHICKSMLAYQKYGGAKEPDKKPDHYVGDWYVRYAKEAKAHPEFEEKIQEMLRKWEDGDREIRELWKKMNEWAFEGMQQTYKRYGVEMEKPYYESNHYTKGKDIVLDSLKKGHFHKDEKGNIYYADKEIDKKIVLRADGTSIYITQDIALGKLRYDDYRMDKMVYVVASEQIHHFKVLFNIFDMLKYPFAKDCYHLAYGMVYLPEGKMKSREGNVVDADNLADEMHEAAKKEIQERHKSISKKELERRAESIGMAAVKFFILKYDPMKDFVFNPKESLSFEGETGPYVQYTHARACSILKKHKKKVSDEVEFSLLNSDEDKAILRLLEDFPKTAEAAANEYKPSLITRHLLDLSQAFNEYYHKHKIVQKDKNLEKARILLVDCVRQVIETGLRLLGIEAPEEM
ncbi:arginine--tRNA ligase [Candidatus Woesearchaeota archaeon]|nr:arginine--tRNA ligase [Candidatus Woesearchaeota archaeon]